MVNALHAMWIGYSFTVGLLGFPVLYFKEYIPVFLSKAYKFGKSSKDGSVTPLLIQRMEVPKRWFVHFYMFSSLYFFCITVAAWRRYAFGYHSPSFKFLLDVFCGDRKSSVNPESVVLVSVLCFLQACRRCYECLYISVYSEAKMNVTHYIMGFTFYFGIGLSILCEAPGFKNNEADITFSSGWFAWKQVLGTALFFWGFYTQFKSHVSLANLRKDINGKKIVTTSYVMPSGGWFDYISCPHFLAEIAMYCSANVIFGGQNVTWWLASLFVVTNQTIIALMNHQWYQNNFKNYPPSRKAIVPYIL